MYTPLLEPVSRQNFALSEADSYAEVGIGSPKNSQDILEFNNTHSETRAPNLIDGVDVENQIIGIISTSGSECKSDSKLCQVKTSVDKLQIGRDQNDGESGNLQELKQHSINFTVSHRKKLEAREKKILRESLRIVGQSTSQSAINDGFAEEADDLLAQGRAFSPRLLKRRKPNSCIIVIALFLTTFSDYTLLSLWPPLVPYIYDSRSIKEIVVLFIVKPLTQTILSLYMGRHNQGTLGPAQKVTIGLIALGIAAFLFTNNTSFQNVLLARVLHGFGSALSITGGMALVALISFDSKSKHETTGLILSGVALGVVIGPILGLLTVDISFEIPFLVVAILLCISFLLVLIFFCCMYDEFDHPGHSISNTALNGDDNVAVISPERKRYAYINPFAVFLGICILIGNMIMSLIEVTIPPYVANNYGLGPRYFCLIWIMIPLSYLAVAAIGRCLLNKITHKWKVLVAGFAISVVALPLVVSPYVKVASQVSPFVDINLALGLVGVAAGCSLIDTSSVPVLFSKAIEGVNAHILHDISAALGYIIGPLAYFFLSPASNRLREVFYVLTCMCLILALSSALLLWRKL